jgi:peptidyl-prolyl cis-trans isomerase SurA
MTGRLCLFAAELALSLALGSLPCLGAAMPGDSVVAVVEGEVITVHDVAEYTGQEEARLRSQWRGEEQRQQIGDLRRLAVRRLIDRELVYAEFKKLGAKVPFELLQSRIDQMVISRCGGDRVKFEELLAEEKMTFADFEEKVRKQVAVDMLLHERVSRGVTIGPERIEAYYRDRSGELAQKAGVRLQAVVLKKAEGRYSATLEATVAEILAKLKAGTSFEEVAKAYSEGPHAEDGGDQGWITAPSGKLQEAIQGLAIGDVSPSAVDLGSNLYVLKVTDRRAESVPVLDEALRKRIEEILRREEEARRYDTLLADLSKKYHVKTPEEFDRTAEE